MSPSQIPFALGPWSPWPLGLVLIGTVMLGMAAQPAGAQAAAGGVQSAQAVIEAVRLAFGLEAAYWDNPKVFRTQDAVYAHFRRGFSPDLAAAMTAHVLTGDGDLATWVPEQVHLVELEGSHALVWFPTAEGFGRGGLWGLADYMHVRLRRDSGRWVVDWAEDRAAPPAR